MTEVKPTKIKVNKGNTIVMPMNIYQTPKYGELMHYKPGIDQLVVAVNSHESHGIGGVSYTDVDIIQRMNKSQIVLLENVYAIYSGCSPSSGASLQTTKLKILNKKNINYHDYDAKLKGVQK